MYILKNAFRNIARSKGRNILIGIIVFIIALSLCIGLSIRQAAANARETALADMSITAQISVDRNKMMEEFRNNQSENGEAPSFDKSSFKGFSDSLSVEEMQKYAKASTVDSFYYTLTSSLDGTGDLEAVTDSSNDSSDTDSTDNTDNTATAPNAPGKSDAMQENMGGKMERINGNGDFSIVGYSDDNAMTDFINGVSTITDGSMFEEGTDEYQCVISQELASYNSLEVGDTIKLANPNDEDETYKLSIVGIYSTSDTVENGMGGMFSNSDPSNKILMSYNSLKQIVDKSTDNSEDTAVFSQTMGTYTFASVDDYNTFAEEVYDLGLSDEYTVNSTDLQAFENSLVPIETLSTIAGYFLIVILAIGTLILIILNIFSIRERKYEIGVLTAIGMKKAKVALQFVYEMLIVTLIAVILGGAVGSAVSVPVANTMLVSQVTAQQESGNRQEQAFGREMGNSFGNKMNTPASIGNNQDNFISQITASVDLTVLLELLGICVLLALIASAVSVCFILRYNPLRILSNRD
ncbi:MAG: ABC transporter permease [Ruminococcus sp.]